MTKKVDKMSKTKKKQVERPYKKGAVVTLYSNCAYSGCKEENTVILDKDYSEEELQAYAWENAMEQIQVEAWFVVGEKE